MRLAAVMATLVALVPATAIAQPVAGLYAGVGAGVNLLPGQRTRETVFQPPLPAYGSPGALSSASFRTTFSAGGVQVLSVGYSFGNGLRFEAEGDYRYNPQKLSGYANPSGLREQKFGGMANVLYDLGVGVPFLNPSLGLLAGLSATVEYRFLGLADSSRTSVDATFQTRAVEETSGNTSHGILVGLRYALGAAAAPEVVPPRTVTGPGRGYIVFFDWDRADLTERARQVIAGARTGASSVHATQIELQGNTDTSGTPAYNRALSLRRAQAVAAKLVRIGMPRSEIVIRAFGDTQLLIPTGPGVRAPQNRRVEIIIR